MSSTSISDKGSLKHFELPVAEANQLDNSVWRKFDWRILPVAAMFYFLSFLDRSNIGNARIAGMQKDLKMSDHDYSVALTVTYVPYIIAELPSNLFLKYVGPDRMLPTMVTLWGLVCTMQGITLCIQKPFINCGADDCDLRYCSQLPWAPGVSFLPWPP